MSKSFSLFFSLNFLESFTPSMVNPAGSITAPATTSPYRQPLPTSSMHAICLWPSKYNSCSISNILFTSFGVLKSNFTHHSPSKLIQNNSTYLFVIKGSPLEKAAPLGSDCFHSFQRFTVLGHFDIVPVNECLWLNNHQFFNKFKGQGFSIKYFILDCTCKCKVYSNLFVLKFGPQDTRSVQQLYSALCFYPLVGFSYARSITCLCTPSPG